MHSASEIATSSTHFFFPYPSINFEKPLHKHAHTHTFGGIGRFTVFSFRLLVCLFVCLFADLLAATAAAYFVLFWIFAFVFLVPVSILLATIDTTSNISVGKPPIPLFFHRFSSLILSQQLINCESIEF